jgi:outer membrane lipoprotein-sorting protein
MTTGRLVGSLLVLVVAASAKAGVPTAEQVIAKCLASYDAARTYQGKLAIHIVRGDQDARTTLDLKAENGSNGKIARSAIRLTTSSHGPSGSTSTEMLIVDNGTTVFTVDTRNKQYWSQPHSEDRISGMFRRLTENARQSVSMLKVALERFHGRPVYKVAGSGVSGAVSIVVDRETYQIYSAEGSGGAAAAPFRSELAATDQAFNKPIAADAFKWTPPTGFARREGGQGKP